MKAHDLKARIGLAGPPLQPTRTAPPVVPDHELVRCIGQGSYGEVWLARNAVGTWRAVKVVCRDRFKDARPYEREFIGIQKYEPISRTNEGLVDVLQIGRNDAEGYFYYVMELADDASAECGTRNAEWELNPEHYVPKTLAREIKSRGRLPTEECVPLGITLCLALGHLHRSGLIHRDVKPSNIIFVNGVPKLADIGLVTDVVEAQSFVGTEGFIPPEGPNSAQADLYALGKVLYEASMGKDRNEFPEPYTGLAVGAESKALMELNAVLLRACAPAPKQRYHSAEEMNADLALLHSGKSVKDKHALERRLKLMTRTSIAIIAVMLLGVVPYCFAIREARLARESTRKAQAEAAKSDQVAGLLAKMLQGVGPSVARGRDTKLLHDVLDQAARNLSNELTNQPEVEADVRLILAQTYDDLMLYSNAVAMAQEAVRLRRMAPGPNSEALAEALHKLGRIQTGYHGGTWGHDPAAGEKALREALTIVRKPPKKESWQIAAYLDSLGAALEREEKLSEAEASQQEALVIRRKLFGNRSRAVANSLNNLGMTLRFEGRLAEAEESYREALGICREMSDLEVPDIFYNFGKVLEEEGKLDQAEAEMHESLKTAKKLYGDENPRVVFALMDLAGILIAKGKMEEADKMLTDCLAVLRRDPGSRDPLTLAERLDLLANRLFQRGNYDHVRELIQEALTLIKDLPGNEELRAHLLFGLGRSYIVQWKVNEAEAPFRQVLEMRSTLRDKKMVSDALNNLLGALFVQRKYEQIDQIAQEILLPAIAQNPKDPQLLALKALTATRWGRWNEARSDAEKLMALDPSKPTGFHTLAAVFIASEDIQGYRQLTQQLLVKYGSTTNPIFADPVAKDCMILPPAAADLPTLSHIAEVASSVSTNHSLFWWCQFCKGLAEYRTGQFASAVETMRKTIAGKPQSERLFEAHMVLSMAQFRLQQLAEARATFDKGLEIRRSKLPDFDQYGCRGAENWTDCVFGEALRKEAKALLGTGTQTALRE